MPYDGTLLCTVQTLDGIALECCKKFPIFGYTQFSHPCQAIISIEANGGIKRQIFTYDVVFPMNVPDIFKPLGGISQTAVLQLFGIQSTKYAEFLFCVLSICSSISFIDMRPLKIPTTQINGNPRFAWKANANLEGTSFTGIQLQRLNIYRCVDHMRPSYFLHRTFVWPVRARKMIDIAVSRAKLMERSRW